MLRSLLVLCLVACSASQPTAPALDSGSDAASGSEVSADALDLGPFAAAPRDGTWTFIPFADAYCADGTPTGIGVSLTTASDDLLIYLNGGGACWDAATCAPAAPETPCATNLNSGYDETHGEPAWSTFSDPTTFAGTIFDRTDAGNPFRTFNFIHVFYCTGDTHAGSAIASYTIIGRDHQPHPVHHVGYQNLQTYVRALHGAFRPGRVVISGSSAGGFGSYTGYDLVASTFAPAPVYMVDDAGPYLEPQYVPAGNTAGQAWNIAAALPAGCATCTTDMTALAPYLSNAYPDGRMALVSSTEDGEIRQRYQLDGPGFAAALASLQTNVLSALPNWQVFYMAGSTHTAIAGLVAHTTPCGRGITNVTGLSCAPTLQQWLADELDSPTWTSATPPPGAPGTQQTFPSHPWCAIGN